MVPAAVPAERAQDPDPDADATPWADRRWGDRRPARAEARLEFRRDGLSPGPDVSIALLDVSPGGLKVAVGGLLSDGERVLVSLGPPDGSWAYQGPAVVHWCVPGAEGTALAGVRLQRPLTARQVADLAES
jgi:hypothetical protein